MTGWRSAALFYLDNDITRNWFFTNPVLTVNLMPFFRNTKQLYVCSEQLFYRIHEEDPKAGNALTASKLMIQLHLTEPDGVVVLNGRSKPMRFHFGTNSEKPDLTVTLTADTLHQILLGELGLRQAMSAKLITVDGPVIKAMMLAPLFQHSQQIYPQILREQGLA